MGNVTGNKGYDLAGGAKPRAILCDRNSLFSEAVVKLLSAVVPVKVMVMATTSIARELPALLLQHKPDLLLLELDLEIGQDASSLALAADTLPSFLRALLEVESKLQVIGMACSYHATLNYHRLKDVLAALCWKPGIIEELPAAIVAASSGKIYCSSVIEELMTQRCRHEILTDSEFQVLLRISLPDEIIAAELSWSQAQVADAVTSLCGKLAVASRHRACLWALSQGYKLLPSMNLLAEEEEAAVVAKRILGG